MKPDRFTIYEAANGTVTLMRNGKTQICPYRDMTCSSQCALFAMEWSKTEHKSSNESVMAQIKVIQTAVILGCSSMKIGLDYDPER